MATYGPEEFKAKDGGLVTIRYNTPSDVDAFLVFQPQAASETTHTLQMVGRTPDRAKVRESWESAQSDSTILELGAYVGDRMVATLGFFPERRPAHPWTQHIGRFGMIVLQEFWGQGIARRLLEIMESHAREIGVSRIEAFVRTQNERGVRLYTRMGYEIEGTRRCAARIDGQAHDEYYIAKLFNQEAPWLPPRLETERLILRPLEMADAAAIFDYAKNPNVSRFTLWEPHESVKDSEAFLHDYVFAHYREKAPEPWAITLKSDPGRVIGTVGCFWVSETAGSMELAYALGEPHWRKGLATEASRAAIGYCFEELKPLRMQARCKTENKASAKVMEKIGMRFEGTLRSAILHRNRHWDMHYYAVLRDEWRS